MERRDGRKDEDERGEERGEKWRGTRYGRTDKREKIEGEN